MEQSPGHDRIPAEHLLDCVWRMDLDLRITYVNSAAESMFGIPASVLVGSLLADLTTAEDHAHLSDMVHAAQSAGDRTAGLIHETRIKHADGRLIPVEVHSRLLLDHDGRPLELMGVARDVSDRRKRERRDRRREQQRLEAQKMAAVARLAARVVDDLQAVVTELATAAPSPLADRAAARLAQLTAIAGRQVLDHEDLDVDRHLDGVVADIRATLPGPVELGFRAGVGGSTTWADRTQIAQAVRALVVNAASAMPDGGTITVATSLRPADPGPDGPPRAPARPWIVIEVADDGPGFDHATRERVLEPFFTAGGDGEGLGLAVVHGIVGQHDGQLEITSRAGEGSAFRVLLPSRFVDDIRAGATDPTAGATGRTVLLVDDDPDIRQYCERVLRSGGFGVISCADGAEALACIAGGEPVDAVVLDWALPGLTGRRVREQIKRRVPDLPLLVISGHASKDYEALGGIDSDTPWLAKPFTPPALLAALRSLLPTPTEAPGS